MTLYPRGSEWRRWDLHVHTASSYEYGYKGKDADQLLANVLKNNEIVAVAITDHFVIDKDRIENLRTLAPEIVFFPGVELRTDKGDTNIHVILIFSDEINLDILAESFNVFKREKGKEIDNEEKIYWDFNDIVEFAKRYDALISIHAGRKTNGVDDRITNKLEHNQAVKEEYAKNVHIFEMGQLKDIDGYHIKVFPTIGKKPLIICSDNHDPRVYSPPEKLWIKADVTFNGLKQIVFEPIERVRVSPEKPEPKPDYFVIERAEITDDDFQREPIYFNNKLTCIIGGKSTGKSILLHNLALALDKTQVEEKDLTSQTRTKKDLSVDVYWADGKGVKNGERKIVYIPQTYLNKLCDAEAEKTEIDRIIQDVILSRDSGVKETFDRVAISIKNAKQEYGKLILDLIGAYNEKNEIVSQIKDMGDKNGIIAEKEKLINERERLNAESALTTDEITNYENATTQIDTLSAAITTTNAELTELSTITTLVEPKQHTYRFTDNTKSVLDEVQKRIISNADVEWQAEKTKLMDALTDGKISKTEDLLKAQAIEKDLSEKIKGNKTIADLTERLKTESDKLVKIERLETIICDSDNAISEMLNKIIISIVTFENLHKEFADVVNSNTTFETRDLEFSVEVPFKSKAFLGKLSELYKTNLTAFKTLIKPEDPDYIRHGESTLKEIALKTLSGELQLKAGCSPEKALREIYDDWFEVKYKVVMGYDSIDVMSPGKKALVLLKLLIELAESECPILIDQPEDDLDNRSVFDELIDFIKTKKKKRQIIIVTHNANIVVGADADEVIVANQHGNNAENKAKRFEYRSGSIENNVAIFHADNTPEKGILNEQGIQQHICDILEGGTQAFELRKRKYRI